MITRADQFMTIRPEGLYCVPGDFYIDPVRPVERAVITHGHADHARPGHGSVLATTQTLMIMAVRYGAEFASSTQSADLGEVITLGDTRVSLHPAGHVLGSAQVLVEHGGHRLVASGDYKRHADPTVMPFDVVPCGHLHHRSNVWASRFLSTHLVLMRWPNFSSRLLPFQIRRIWSAPTRLAKRSV